MVCQQNKEENKTTRFLIVSLTALALKVPCKQTNDTINVMLIVHHRWIIHIIEPRHVISNNVAF